MPEGKGIRAALREKYFEAKWRGVEKCSVGVLSTVISKGVKMEEFGDEAGRGARGTVPGT